MGAGRGVEERHREKARQALRIVQSGNMRALDSLASAFAEFEREVLEQAACWHDARAKAALEAAKQWPDDASTRGRWHTAAGTHEESAAALRASRPDAGEGVE